MRNAPLEPTSALVWSTVTARGEDAETFLQGQLTQDLSNVTDLGAWTLLLAPDSAVIASAYVTRVEGGFDLVFEREHAEVALARLRRFLLRAKCELLLVEGGETPYGTVGDEVAALWPGANEFARALTPHSYGRHVVESTISFTKGCYTGQELVGRLDARGAKVPWRLVAVSGPSAEAIDDVLQRFGPEGPKGATTLVHAGDRVRGLGIAHRSALGAQWDDDVVVSSVD